MKTPLSYHDLIETFPRGGCAICLLIRREVSRYLDSLFYEFVNDVETNARFRAARGLCNLHAHQLSDLQGRILGVAILYHASLDEVLSILVKADLAGARKKALQKLFGQNGAGKSELADALEPTTTCPACDVMDMAERRYAQTLGETLQEPRILEGFRQSAGLCLPHLKATLRYVEQDEDVSTLLTIQREQWAALRDDLWQFIEMNDYRRRDQPMGKESDSPLRGIRAVSGEKDTLGNGR